MRDAKWFSGAELNLAENLLRPEVPDRQVALKVRTEGGAAEAVTYGELKRDVARVAASLRAVGLQAGDTVAGCVTNGVAAVVAMLATTSLGAIWSSCSPDFGPVGILDRFGQVQPKVLFAVDGYVYNGKRLDICGKVAEVARQLGPTLRQVVVIPTLHADPDLSGIPLAVSWDRFLDPETPRLEFRAMPFDHPVYILFTSGTTGPPKCIAHRAGGVLLQHLKELLLHTDLRPGEVMFYHTTCGWMMWNWMVSGLGVAATLVLYDGSPMHPSAGHFFDILQAEKVSTFGTSAKFLAAVEKAGVSPIRTHQFPDLKAVLSTGSVLAETQFDWVYRNVKPDLRLSSISGGTDLVSCFALGCPVLPVRRGELQCRGLGMAVEVFDEAGKPVLGEKGELVCTRPFPVQPVCFWNDPDGAKYHKAYFSKWDNVWVHGDYAELTADGGIVMHGRSDAILNPKGVRIGTAEIYRVVDSIEEVQESVAVGQPFEGDERIILFVRMRPPHLFTTEVEAKLRRALRENATPHHVPARILAVSDIPRTGSGKITEVAVRDLVHGRPITNLEAIANVECLVEFTNRPELAT
eukprot:GGOE01020809.1.p1 GENE.GGOE01020809.1~~GGOE01020809.1.p1  ORF type:complete len:665 (-),score=167.64 GGOE01020809.1:207-1940(-)